MREDLRGDRRKGEGNLLLQGKKGVEGKRCVRELYFEKNRETTR